MFFLDHHVYWTTMYRVRSSVSLQQNFPTWNMRPVCCNLNRSLEKVGEIWWNMGDMFVRMCLRPSYQTSLKVVGKKHLPEANMFAPENPGLESMHFLLGTGPVAGAKNKWVVSGSVASDQQIVVWTVVSGSRNRGRWYIIPQFAVIIYRLYTTYILLSGVCYLPTRSNHWLCIPKFGYPVFCLASPPFRQRWSDESKVAPHRPNDVEHRDPAPKNKGVREVKKT